MVLSVRYGREGAVPGEGRMRIRSPNVSYTALLMAAALGVLRRRQHSGFLVRYLAS